VEGIDKGFFIFGRNANGALPGDKVLAETKEFNGKIEATITDIIERRTDPVVGIYQGVKKDGMPARFGFVIPQNKDFKQDFFVAGRNSKDAKDGELVAIEIVNSEGRKPEGKVIKVLGNPEKK
jgi:exoribonuclease R